ncbi:hypothetical protein ADH70_001390 [Blautia pseudococcoides]|uniref:Uncharacterized protein n=1 Tax=Blautia pseudococcoides TaxID=1796616 RepID=A0A1C7I8F8_9FIRM|nr:hypothetical protein A4V09_03070 [Blautia pseudococcoides]ASU27638.1 hypothetical protein ADH70_001390 [Blautia pseudococcoides]
MTVPAYDPLTDHILTNAGRGYTRINQITPDVAAPGYQTSCAFLDKRYDIQIQSGDMESWFKR